MTVPVWPASLPRPDRETWQRTPQEARIKRQSTNGPPGYRRRFSSVAQMVTLSLTLTRADAAVFDMFFQETTEQGARPFWMPDPTTDGWRLIAADGGGLLTHEGTPILISAWWLCLFGDSLPVESIVGSEFRKTFTVVVLP